MSKPKSETCRQSREERMRIELPYGLWTCADGREVLFNRWYSPIWQRMPGGPAEPADPGERIPYASQSWFYTDADPPWQKKATLAKCEEVLRGWGAPTPDWPIKRFKPRAAQHELYRGDGYRRHPPQWLQAAK